MIICVHCGKTIPDVAKFCPICGGVQADPGYQLQSAPAELPSEGPLKVPEFGEAPTPTVSLTKAPPLEKAFVPAKEDSPAEPLSDSPLKVPEFGDAPAPARVNIPAETPPAVSPGKEEKRLPPEPPKRKAPEKATGKEKPAAAKRTPPPGPGAAKAAEKRPPAPAKAKKPPVRKAMEGSRGKKPVPVRSAAAGKPEGVRREPSKARPKKKKTGVVTVLVTLLVLVIGAVAAFLILRANRPVLDVKQFRFTQSAFGLPEDPGKAEPVHTLVMAVIDPSQRAAGLTLRAVCEENGDSFILTDDGNDADTLKGDRVFYGKATFSPKAEERLTYRLEVDSGSYSLSGRLTAGVDFYKLRSVEDEMKAIPGIIAEMDQIAAEFSVSSDPARDAEAYEQVEKKIGAYLDGLVSARKIASWTFSIPNFTVRMGYGSFVYNYDTGITGVTGSPAAGTTGYEVIIANENRKMLLLLPAGDADGLDGSKFVKAMETLSESGWGYQAAVRREKGEVSAEVLKSLSEYRVIMVYTHGGFSEENGSFFQSGIPNGQIGKEDYAGGRLLYGSGGTALVTAAFFEQYYNDGALNDCLFYLASCGGADDTRLTDTLLSKGANTVVAFTGIPYCTYHDAMIGSIANELIQIDPETGDEALTKDILRAARFAMDQNDDADRSGSQWFNLLMERYDRGASEMKVTAADSANPFRLVNRTGDGIISGSVLMASDAQTPIPMARIILEGDRGYRCTFYTDSEGRYTYSPPAGDYLITVSMEGYLDLRFSARVVANHTTFLESFLLVREDTQNLPGKVTGYVNSALNSSGIVGAKLKFYRDWNNIKGTPMATADTEQNGRYTVELPQGNYTVLVSAEGYLDLTFNVVSVLGSSRDQNASMNVAASGAHFRIVLNWGKYPEDLDIHLEGPSSSGFFHVYYHEIFKEFTDSDGVQVCKLDVDSRRGYGPETITLLPVTDGPYYCYVHRYEGTTKTLSESGATLKLYSGSQLLQTFNVPTGGGDSDYWNVFAIVNGQILTENSMTKGQADITYAFDWLTKTQQQTKPE